LIGGVIGAATGGALFARSRMMNRAQRTLRGRTRRTMGLMKSSAARIGDAVKVGALAFTRKLLS